MFKIFLSCKSRDYGSDNKIINAFSLPANYPTSTIFRTHPRRIDVSDGIVHGVGVRTPVGIHLRQRIDT
jgi:hypothetical protein